MEILLDNVIRALGWTIIQSLWQGAILYAGLNLILLLNPKLTARSRYNLSFLTIIGIFLWSLITFYTELIRTPALVESSDAGVFFGSSITILNFPASVINSIEQGMPIVVCLYCIGLMLRMGFLVISYSKTSRLKAAGLSEVPADLYTRFSNLVIKLGIKRRIRLNISTKVSVPQVIGYFKPIVLLPLSVITQLEPSQIETIIVHELAHIRRSDYFFNLIKVFVETILFFNPFVLMTGKMIDTERENACDDLVIELTGKPLIYIETLFRLQKFKYEHEQFSMAITGKKYQLLSRIKRIANTEQSTFSLKPQLFAIALAFTMVLSLAWMPSTKKKPETKEDASQNYSERNIKPLPDLRTDTPIRVLPRLTRKPIKIMVDEKKERKDQSLKELSSDAPQDALAQRTNDLPPYQPIVNEDRQPESNANQQFKDQQKHLRQRKRQEEKEQEKKLRQHEKSQQRNLEEKNKILQKKPGD